jgi:hypothetical protein
MPLLAVGSVVMTPDTPSVLFWGLSSWALAELYASRNATWWLAVGAFAGLGLLSKYTNLFLGAGIALWLSGLPENRHWLRSWQLWAGGALAAILVLPVIVWNLEHDWASFAKQFGRVGRGESLTLRYLVEFVGSYVGLASPVIAAFSLWGLGLVVRSATAKRDPSHALVAAGILPLLIYFLVHALRQRVQANWAAPLYPALAICAALALAQLSGASGRRLSLAAVALGLAMSVLLYVHIVHPMVRLSDLRDSTAQMRGWPELAANLERLRVANGTQWIATSSYATTGQLAFALRGGPPVIQLTERLRYANLPAPNETTLRSPGLYVELDRRENPELLRERFGSVISLGHLVRRDNDGPIASFAVYRISDPRGLVLR